ncbi:hypothetical protein CEXT_314821 [Caerostris extrusa]|uniref:Secreted protein n=1 Tax=Caerostris extrusa TaxID=172846 RepID=A0AAV4N9I7_CAEEX|nr:hypothetical protein CEXT_314821 [Caerostris extrusa]
MVRFEVFYICFLALFSPFKIPRVSSATGGWEPSPENAAPVKIAVWHWRDPSARRTLENLQRGRFSSKLQCFNQKIVNKKFLATNYSI